jgi:large exoprotein involved in heme utilization and adhesion
LRGNAGSIRLTVDETSHFEGSLIASEDDSGVFSRVEEKGEGQSGNIRLSTGNLTVLNGAQLSTSIAGRGNAGNLMIAVRDLARFEGREGQFISGAFSSVASTGEGHGGNVQVSAGNLVLTEGALLSTELAGRGNAGDVTIAVRDTVSFEGSGSGASSRARQNAEGGSGDVVVRANNLFVNGGAQISASNEGRGNAGNLLLTASDRLFAQDGTIATNSAVGAGGQIRIDGGVVALRGDSDIQTFVNNGGNSGGNIAIAANAVVLLDDSDIFAFSPDGQGGKIDLSQTVLFSQNPQLLSDKLSRTDLLALEDNTQVDINATGGTQSGQVSINNANFVENDLTELADNIVNTDSLLANSCIARSTDHNGSFTVSGRDRLPQSSSTVSSSQYSAGTVQPVPTEANFTEANFIEEPQAIYQLADGRFVISRACRE